MRRLGAVLSLIVVSAAIAIAVIWTIANRSPATPDVTALNDATQRITAAWPELQAAELDEVAAEVSVVASTGELLASTASKPITDALDATRRRAMSAPIVVDGRAVAMVYVSSDWASAEQTARREMAATATGAIVAAAAVTVLVQLSTHRRIVQPFTELRDFATRVAGGDLDAPLAMDRHNVFGAWTESFDLMRAELAAAKRREAEIEQSKRDLVAQIGHDIRTPVASIAATAEVLRLHETDRLRLARFDVIDAKTAQIENLVADLFSASDTELAALQINSRDLASAELIDLVRAADHAGRVRLDELPECLLHADPQRLAQVIDNVIANSYKYADTEIAVRGRLVADTLELDFADSGPGLPSEELDGIFIRGVRGSNVGDQPGLGLGLFTAAWLMERMGGDCAAASSSDGFTITITIALA